MRKRSVFQVVMALVMLVTMLGANQSYAQEGAPSATPVVEDGDTDTPAGVETQPEGSPTIVESPEVTDPETSFQPLMAPAMDTGPQVFATGDDEPADTFSISGAVVDDAGTPISGAMVCAGMGDKSYCTHSTADGLYEISGVPRWEDPEYTYEFFANYESGLDDTYYSSYRQWFGQPEGDLVMPVVTLERSPGGRVTGIVTDINGVPITDGEMVCPNCGKGSGPDWPVPAIRTNSSGRFTFEAWPVGSVFHKLLALSSASCPEKTGNWWMFVDVIEITIQPGLNDIGSYALDCDVTVIPPTQVTISGQVTDIDTGDPMPDVMVAIQPDWENDACVSMDASVLTDEDGFYSIRGQEGCIRQLFVEPRWWFDVNLPTVDTTLNLEIAPWGTNTTVIGRLVYTDGTPIEDAFIASFQGPKYGGFATRTLPDGSFRGEGDPEVGQPFTLEIAVDGCAVYDGYLGFTGWPYQPVGNIVHPVTDVGTLVFNCETGEISTAISPVAAVTGSITDADGAPLAGVSICVTGTTQCVTSGADGSYTLPDVTNGERSVTASKAGFVSQTLPVTVAGENVTLNFTMVAAADPGPTSATVAGVIADKDGAPLAGASICVTGTTQCVTSGADGSYTLPDVTNGARSITASLAGFVAQTQPVTVAGETVTLNFAMVRANGPSTETPVLPPTETPVPPTETPTETPQADHTLIVTVLILPNNTSIEGAPYSFYAAQASIAFQTDPFRSGLVSASNTIEITDLLPGTYKLVIAPDGMTPIEAVIEIGDQPLTRVTITVHEDGSVTVEDVPQVVPTAPTEDEQDGEVTALPSTGTGGFNGSTGVLMMLGIAASALMMAGGLAVRQKRG